MNRYAIQDKMIIQYDGTQDNDKIKYALDAVIKLINRETVDQEWRWLYDGLMELYDEHQPSASACYSWINGWISGASSVLNKSILCVLKKGQEV